MRNLHHLVSPLLYCRHAHTSCVFPLPNLKNVHPILSRFFALSLTSSEIPQGSKTNTRLPHVPRGQAFGATVATRRHICAPQKNTNMT